MSEKIDINALVIRSTDEWANMFNSANIDDIPNVFSDMMNSLVFKELDELKTARNVSTGQGMLACIRQMNDKYNAIIRRINRKDGETLKADGVFTIMSKMMNMDLKLLSAVLK